LNASIGQKKKLKEKKAILSKPGKNLIRSEIGQG